MAEQDYSDCINFDEKNPIRPCKIGRMAPVDCPTCTSYDKEALRFGDRAEWDLEDGDVGC